MYSYYHKTLLFHVLSVIVVYTFLLRESYRKSNFYKIRGYILPLSTRERGFL
nr:MAG TPA: hypothetical protein [Caudoviricetes sp.]